LINCSKQKKLSQSVIYKRAHTHVRTYWAWWMCKHGCTQKGALNGQRTSTKVQSVGRQTQGHENIALVQRGTQMKGLASQGHNGWPGGGGEHVCELWCNNIDPRGRQVRQVFVNLRGMCCGGGGHLSGQGCSQGPNTNFDFLLC